MISSIKRHLNNFLKGFNVEIRKYPSTAFTPIPVFRLAVEKLMQDDEQLFFIQVGANDGVYGDPIHDFVIKHNWKGILIEPQPDVFKRLVDNYHEHKNILHFENCAISPDQDQITLYTHENKDDNQFSIYHSSVASVSKSNVNKQLKDQNIKAINVTCKTLDQLVQHYQVKKIDLLQIDAEGHDYEVLKTLNFNTLKPSVIQFETGHLSGGDSKQAVELLHQHGYTIHWGGNQGDAVALHSSCLD